MNSSAPRSRRLLGIDDTTSARAAVDLGQLAVRALPGLTGVNGARGPARTLDARGAYTTKRER
jgi:hypothetical protein